MERAKATHRRIGRERIHKLQYRAENPNGIRPDARRKAGLNVVCAFQLRMWGVAYQISRSHWAAELVRGYYEPRFARPWGALSAAVAWHTFGAERAWAVVLKEKL